MPKFPDLTGVRASLSKVGSAPNPTCLYLDGIAWFFIKTAPVFVKKGISTKPLTILSNMLYEHKEALQDKPQHHTL
jgi:hypothetical protein